MYNEIVSYFHLASFVTSTSCWCLRSSNFSGKYFLQTACMLRVTFYKIVNMHACKLETNSIRINPDANCLNSMAKFGCTFVGLSQIARFYM